MGEESVLIIQIPPNLKKPYFMRTEGFPIGVYVWVGTSTRRASQDYIEDLVREGNRLDFDRLGKGQKALFKRGFLPL